MRVGEQRCRLRCQRPYPPGSSTPSRLIGEFHKILRKEPLKPLSYGLHRDVEPPRKRLGLGIPEALQLEENSVGCCLQTVHRRINITRYILLKWLRSVNGMP